MSSLFRGVQELVAIVEHGTFRGAADALGLTPAAISKTVTALERDVGTRLINRTTRKLMWTTEGAQYVARCRAAVAQLQAGRDALLASRKRPQGKLSVSVSLVLAEHTLRIAAPWLIDHPDVTLELTGNDRVLSLEHEEADVAVRVGAVRDENVVVKTLAQTSWVTVVAPGRSSSDVVLYRHPNGREQNVDTRSNTRLWVNNGAWLLEAARLGVGACQTLDFLAAPLLQAGMLVEVPGTRRAGPPVSVVYLPSRRSVPRIRSFVQHLLARFGSSPSTS
jgi:LysR family transcriptional regulator, regulator for bpeEF and oprC